MLLLVVPLVSSAALPALLVPPVALAALATASADGLARFLVLAELLALQAPPDRLVPLVLLLAVPLVS